MCAVVMAALVINLTCSLFAVLHLRSGELYSSSNCHRSYRSSLDGMDAVIGRGGRSNQCCHYYQDSRAPDRGSRRGQRGAGTGSSLRSLLRLHTASDLGEYRQLAVQHAAAVSVQAAHTFSSTLTTRLQDRRSYANTPHWSISSRPQRNPGMSHCLC